VNKSELGQLHETDESKLKTDEKDLKGR